MTRRRKINPYQVLKAIVSDGMVVNHWWVESGLSAIKKQLDWFGYKALERGVDNAVRDGETVPDEILKWRNKGGN